ncbi:glycoside hydrolase family 105 protein [Agrobacterium vitis]|uniref:Glycoside hydrolase family 105 protein n=2 Tax=Agrobacterium vitis TaxID=373 RepID=A0ABD6GF39_AGRVI|nr:glycoside hydrolase family 88 protein [Agrobacterium vitis]MUO82298.1 glycoside hydrolase family 105 protein [Agrobacterium vitis]MUO97547.1 glycoside hydrolase family 105 protein [Agrobacterium vitis]MUP08067.1 glycoside hydrolase family 105 protein [Agrobacterium vitis]MUZ85217.1 glycoside hydrolase family 105 protein [Agrobacterium vitis]MVA12697.1 glycoside hydrolase family 105 protein [Agrobacterium vitis]
MHPLLAQPERFVTRNEVVGLIGRLTDNLINITDTTGEFLLRLDDGRVIDTKGWAGWEWTHGIGLYGLFKYWQQTGDAKAMAVITDWFSARLAEGTPTKNINTVCPFLTLACLYEHAPNPAFIPYLETWAEWVMYEMPRTREGGLQHIVYNSVNDQQMWDDTLMMSVMPLAKIGLLLNRPDYVEEAKYQFLIHSQYLADRASGLWFHGWTFDGNHNFARALWARGNSWVTIAIPEFIDLLQLPEGDALRRHLLSTLDRQAAALAKYQDPSGLWHTLVDDEGSYLEASATAGFAYGLMKAVRKRYISADYRPVAERAVRGVIANIDAKGELNQVSFGTAMGSDLDFYRNIKLTSMPYGQAMAILCLSEYLRSFI